MAVTVEQAQQYLASQGINLPPFVLEALVENANSINECLEANYSPATALLIQLYLLSLMGLAQGDRYISSQTAPSGASQSYRYGTLKDRWSGQLSLLRALDPKGCAIGIIPADPTTVAYGGIWTARGNPRCGC